MSEGLRKATLWIRRCTLRACSWVNEFGLQKDQMPFKGRAIWILIKTATIYATCNPYRQHDADQTNSMISSLARVGYAVQSDKRILLKSGGAFTQGWLVRNLHRKLAQTCTEPKTVVYECFAPSELQSQVKIELIKPRNGIHSNINGRQEIVRHHPKDLT